MKDKRLENLLVLAFNPSHNNVGNDVHAPLKIFSTLIRALDNEMAPSRKDKEIIKKKDNHECNEDDDDGDERMGSDEDDDYNGNYEM